MKVRFVHQDGDWPHERPTTDSYVDIEMGSLPSVGDSVHLPDEFYGWECEVVKRDWFTNDQRQADVMVTVNS
ncbi:hypothetical protein [Mycobacterium sp. 1245499.0]|uniref:hypothetical protein n=1 Tax=Mycobacterium sp. 1245499.0 TaxID=1834074 RepID=UPI0008295934|nr:hypothetical protein [Mycobacterium sp. 1245499.0]